MKNQNNLKNVNPWEDGKCERDIRAHIAIAKDAPKSKPGF